MRIWQVMGLALAVLLSGGGLVVNQPVAVSPSGNPPAAAPLTVWYAARASQDRVAEGQAWLRMADPARALLAWAPVLPTTDDAAVLRQAAALAQQAGDSALAQLTLERLLMLHTDDARTQQELGLLLAASQPERAAALLTAASESTASTLVITVLDAVRRSSASVAWALFAGEYWPQAELALARAVGEAAPVPLLMAVLALARDYQGKSGEPWMERAVTLGPDDAAVRALQAIHLRLAGDLEGSLEAQIAAAVLAPNSPAILAGLGAAWQRAGDLEQARRWYEQAQALAGDDPRFAALLDSVAQAESAALAALLDALASETGRGAS